jgi:outer membrane protein assembly factor BamD (BamD/ComL family)
MSELPPVNPAPVTQPAARTQPKGASNLQIFAICTGVVVLGWAAFQGWATYSDHQQNQNYQVGQAAYLKADCAAAADPLGKAARGEPGRKDSDFALKATAHLQECQALAAAGDLAAQNKPAEAVLRYGEFIDKYPKSPLQPVALDRRGILQQDLNYQAGQAAYLKADCIAAAEPLGKAARGEPGRKDSDVARKAQAHLQECQAIAAAGNLATQNKPAEAMLRYGEFIDKHPDSPLQPLALDRRGILQQDLNYQAGQAAYFKADCAAAAEPLGKAARGEPGRKDSDMARKAQAHLQECQAIAAASNLAAQNKAAEAVLGYSEFIGRYPKSPLQPLALDRGRTIMQAGQPADLATEGVCKGLDRFLDQQLIIAQAETMPPLLYACGQRHEAAKDFGSAIAFYSRFRRDHADHPLAADVQTAFARATIAEAQAEGAGALPPPLPTRGGSPAAQVAVVVHNESPEHMTIVFQGPDVRVEELAACPDCARFTGTGPQSCPEKGPVGRYILAPGSYDVVVKSSREGSAVRPFRGTWSLEAGHEYSNCFFLVTR